MARPSTREVKEDHIEVDPAYESVSEDRSLFFDTISTSRSRRSGRRRRGTRQTVSICEFAGRRSPNPVGRLRFEGDIFDALTSRPPPTSA
ncbi:hypothetical protein EVAR_94673_1 [Eumeta japonica]|uniref:Uncharacterized protein n=1 Tax=Eumeta variegata TaxID=151549 RepID=A0A4C1SCR4_EUMVA|nr:hypothetical protein EVAR_94673_1 [Eumeta japonica]